ncbi:MAG: hypothetical protein PHY92_00335 [Alphaproteobacteria bacterium]|nr:hypothetical protein [Alphaproteobacteria bacterium]
MSMKTPTLEEAEAEIASLSSRLTVLKNYVNGVYVLNGEQAPYAEGDGASVAPTPLFRPKHKQAPDEFLGKPFAFSAKSVLERRRAGNQKEGPMSADEIYEALKAGGYGFDSRNSIDAQKNGVKIALGKNSQTFTRVPNSDLFGLVEWYGVRGKKATKKSGDADNPAENGSPEIESADPQEEKPADE